MGKYGLSNSNENLSSIKLENIKTESSINLTNSNLIYKQNNNLVLNEIALNQIKSIKENIAVCSIIGSYRSGKSTLLNHLNELICSHNNIKYDSLKSFQVGHDENACTKGLNICGSIPKVTNRNGETMSLLFIDTEGLDSDDCQESWDIKIFMASLLISSIFMFNGQKTLNKQDFNRLSVITTLSDLVKVQQNMAQAMNKKKLKDSCPNFIWLVRDFGLRLTQCKNDYLNKFFEQENTTDCEPKRQKEIDQRNEIKENLESSFKSIDCALLKQPIFGEEELQQLDQMKLSNLRKEYIYDLNELYELINTNLTPKQINDRKMNGELFCEYLKLIIDSINSNKTIYLNETINSAIKKVADHCLEKLICEFNGLCRNLHHLMPLKSSDLEDKLVKRQLNILAKFKSQFENNSLLLAYNEKLKRNIREIQENLMKKNDEKKIEKDFKKALSDFKQKFDFFLKIDTLNQFELELDRFKIDFKLYNSFDNNDEYEKKHLNDQFWNDVLNHDDANVNTLRRVIIRKEEQKRRDEQLRYSKIKFD